MNAPMLVRRTRASVEPVLALRTSRPGSMSALVALTAYLSIELVRVFAPTVTWQVEGRSLGGLALAGSLVAPMVGAGALLFMAMRTDPRRAMLALGVVLVVARLLVQWNPGPSTALIAAVGVCSALAMVGLLATMGLPLFGGGVVAGVVLDSALHAALDTRSLVSISGPWAMVAVLALAGWYLALVGARTRRDVFSLGRSPLASIPLAAIGPVLIVEAFMLGNFGWVGAVVGLGWLGSSIVIGLAGGAGVFAAALTARHPASRWPLAPVLGGVSLVALAWAGDVPSVWWTVAIVGAQVGIGSALTAAVARGAGSGGARAPVVLLTLGYLVLVGGLCTLDGRGLLGLAVPPGAVLVAAGAGLVAVATVITRQIGPPAHHTGRAEIASICGVFVVPATLLLAGVPVLASVGGPSTAGEVRVVTYNVSLALDAHGRLNLDRVAAVLVDAEADIVGLQEVPRGYLPTGGVDMVGWLQYSLDMPYVVFQPSAPGALHGNAILSKHPILSVERREFPRVGTALPRGAVAAHVRLPDGSDLRFITAHLPPGGTPAARSARTGALLSLWGGGDRTIIAADLNTAPSSEIIEELTDAGLNPAWDPAWGAGATYPASAPRARIDWVLMSDDLSVVDGGVHESSASDHLAVSASIRLSD